MKIVSLEGKLVLLSLVFLVGLAGFTSAGLVYFISNLIEGSADVGGPVFYLDGSETLFFEGTSYRNLSLNSIPAEEDETYIYNGNRIVFASEQLGIDSFYQAEFRIVLWAKTNFEGNFLQFEVIKLDSDLVEEIICVPIAVMIDSVDEFDRYETYCVSEEDIELGPEVRFGLEIAGAGGSSEYWIKTGREFSDGYSRMEVNLPLEEYPPPEESFYKPFMENFGGGFSISAVTPENLGGIEVDNGVGGNNNGLPQDRSEKFVVGEDNGVVLERGEEENNDEFFVNAGGEGNEP